MLRRGTPISRFSALLLVAAAGTLLVLGIVRPALTKFADGERRIDSLRGQLARLDAAAARAEARRGTELSPADIDLQTLLLPRASEATATARLQERFGGIIETAGARLSTTQVLPVKALATARRIGLRLQFAADTTSLRSILHALEYQRPVAIVENLFIFSQSSKVVGNPLPLTVRLDVHAFLPAER